MRLAPGDPENSVMYVRMGLRGDHQMPPLATEIVDSAGVDLVRRWVASLPP